MSQRFLLPGIQARQAGDPPFDPSLPNDTIAPMILGISGFLTGLAFLIVLSRCYVRLVMLKVFGTDDWIMLFAMVCEWTSDPQERFGCMPIMEVSNSVCCRLVESRF